MKKKIKFILTLIIVLTGSYICTTIAASNLMQTKPEFTTKPVNQKLKEGETIRVEAIIAGNPYPKVTFYKNDTTIHENSRTRITNDSKGKYTLTISGSKNNDTGEYKIIAENNIGRDKVTCKIEIK